MKHVFFSALVRVVWNNQQNRTHQTWIPSGVLAFRETRPAFRWLWLRSGHFLSCNAAYLATTSTHYRPGQNRPLGLHDGNALHPESSVYLM